MNADRDTDDAAAPRGLILDTADPPDELPFADFEDYRARELLKVNGLALTDEALLPVLGSGEPVLPGAAAHALGSLGRTAAIPALKKLADSASDLVKVEAAYALVRLGLDDYREVLKECLNYPVNAYLAPPVAAGDLARLGDPVGFPVVARCFDVDNLIVRVIACKQLIFFIPFHGARTGAGQPIDVSALFDRALHDEHQDVQWIALRQLREIRTPEARHLLAAAADGAADAQLRDAARCALERLG